MLRMVLGPARQQIQRLLTDTCVVTSRVRVDTAGGGYTYTTTTRELPCRLGPVGGGERAVAGQVISEADAAVTLPWDAEIAATDTITHEGLVYEVVDVQNRTDRVVRRVWVRRSG